MEGPSERFSPKLYYFHPLQAGSRDIWPHYLGRCQQMGFDSVLVAPVFAPGGRGEIFLAGDHERANPSLGRPGGADELIADLAQQCAQHGLALFLDVVIGRVAADADLVRSDPSWFRIADSDGGRIDPRFALGEPDAASVRFDDPSVAGEAADWWIDRLCRLGRSGASGFRCLSPQLVPPDIWRRIISGVRQEMMNRCCFLAWTPGLDWRVLNSFEDIGFAATFSSLPWWDGHATWFVEEHERLRRIGQVIASPEAPFGPRLARRFQDSADILLRYRQMMRCAAATGDGMLVPMGFEYACSEDMRAKPEPNDGFTRLQGVGNIDLTTEIAEANTLSERVANIGLNGAMSILNTSNRSISLLRCNADDARQASDATVILINHNLHRDWPVPITLRPLPSAAGAGFAVDEVLSADLDADSPLRPGEVRVLHARRTAIVSAANPTSVGTHFAAAPRIAIENVAPSLDGGRFAAKRVIGESVEVDADVFIDGHDVLVVDLLWRAIDELVWRRAEMHSQGNDRWRGVFFPERIGRYEFTIEAWIDKYGSLCRDLEIKAAAQSDISLEIAEAQELLQRASTRAQADQSVIHSALSWLNDASGEFRGEIVTAAALREVMREAEEHGFRTRHDPCLALEIERPQAAFGAWYELFPRSATDNAERHGTLRDVIAKLPMIRDMGFDVLYLPPIHPIGATNRKGKNNALTAAPEDVGSPYAIGALEGGHDAIHPALGTFDDFRALRDAAGAHGIEIALDFAIQCSPDHPWLRTHPQWFNWRPDGTIRYAENPPKKYEDIVNIDFYAKEAVPDLWHALCDIVVFWIGQGVRIFRVDNPHTKPLPFWEWIIGQIRAQHPDVIFLSEAFTRPKMMYRLAKVGFSQSYTYFTWRNSKRELIDYFTELTSAPVKEFFRPHLFVNTPDINPYFLQTSGRPGFLIRAALAATLSGLWGIYSGFELCKSTPLPGREEYLDSEKYAIRIRHHDMPGNIVSEISKLNRIRKSNPALQSHLGLRFYPAYSDQVIFYGKPLPAQDAMVVVAVSLDPFHVQEVTIEVPLWEWGLPDHASVSAHDLMRDSNFIWNGKLQRIKLDPAGLPFAIWRIAPRTGG